MKSKTKAMFIFGTRPEAIKMAPIIRCFRNSDLFSVEVCITAQHREMLDMPLRFFHIKPDYDLNIMKKDQSMFSVVIEGMKGLQKVLADAKPDIVFVHGDTTTTFVGALAAYYNKIAVVHIEAGLRSGNKLSPYPEEMNRVLAGRLTDYHFAPTKGAAKNLSNEGIHKNVWVVGNSVIDALFWGLDIINKNYCDDFYKFFRKIDFSKKVVLVTSHRRESFGGPFKNICDALRMIALNNKDSEIVYPVHMNPNIKIPAHEYLGDIKNIHLMGPVDYPHFIWLMSKSYLVLTDSGGVQEEAPSLKKPVLVLRDVTERMEGVEAGTAVLVGTNKKLIVDKVSSLLHDSKEYNIVVNAENPYGRGDTSENILKILIQEVIQ